jgi:hypothetical protein
MSFGSGPKPGACILTVEGAALGRCQRFRFRLRFTTLAIRVIWFLPLAAAMSIAHVMSPLVRAPFVSPSMPDRDTLIRLALEAGAEWHSALPEFDLHDAFTFTVEQLQQFALAVKAE